MDTVVATDSLTNKGTAAVTVKPKPMNDGGVEGGTDGGGSDAGMKDGGSKMDGSADAAPDGSMSGTDSGSGEDSGQMGDATFEAGEEGGAGGGQTSSNSGCGCTTAGGDTSALGSLGALAFGLAFAVRRRRRG
ncbi:MAG TPA: MYXO-CTERM sorting domain-containing protein, partial [Polyangiaceae bacterium]